MTPAQHTQASASQSSAHRPFWDPWGAWGCLWRTMVMLLGLVLISLLIGVLLRGCGGSNRFDDHDNSDDKIDSTLFEDSLRRELPPELRDSSLVDDWNDSIPGVAELPDPRNNYIPPVDSTDFITNPEDSARIIVGNQIIVLFDSQDLEKDIVSFARQFKRLYPGNDYSVVYYNKQAGTMILQVPDSQLISVLDELPRSITDINFAVDVVEVLAECGRPSDPGFGVADYDSYYRLIQAYEAWDVTQGNPDVKVAIVDSYFDLSHPEIGSRYVDPIHIPSKTRMVLPPDGPPHTEGELTAYCHGSHVAGIAIGGLDNRLGCSGIAPKCSWIPISLGTQLTSFNIIEGILYAAYHGADVVNASLGTNWSDDVKSWPLKKQVEFAQHANTRGERLWNYVIKTLDDHNCVLVFSSGNEGLLTGMESNKRHPNVIKVEAVDAKGTAAGFTNYGKVPEAHLDYSTVAAPGVGIWSVTDRRCVPIWRSIGYKASLPDGFQEMDGTSMSAPVVTGAVALLKSKNKQLSAQQIVDILVSTGLQTDTKHRIGPTLQLRAALDATGGTRLNFDDLMHNHDLLKGKWKSTKTLNLETNGVVTDKLWQYFIFPSTDAGTTEYHMVSSKHVYSATVTVDWNPDRVTFTLNGPATSPGGDVITQDYFVCRPDKNKQLEVSCMRSGKERYKFYLEKVN